MVAALDLLRDTALDVAMVDHYASEEVVRALFAHPLGLVGSDGIYGAHPHPRLHGTAARVLGRYCAARAADHRRGGGRATLRVAPPIASACAIAAASGRGCAQTSSCSTPTPSSTPPPTSSPCQAPPGVVRVLVGGEAVVRDGRPTGARPGGVVRSSLIPT